MLLQFRAAEEKYLKPILYICVLFGFYNKLSVSRTIDCIIRLYCLTFSTVLCYANYKLVEFSKLIVLDYAALVAISFFSRTTYSAIVTYLNAVNKDRTRKSHVVVKMMIALLCVFAVALIFRMSLVIVVCGIFFTSNSRVEQVVGAASTALLWIALTVGRNINNLFFGTLYCHATLLYQSVKRSYNSNILIRTCRLNFLLMMYENILESFGKVENMAKISVFQNLILLFIIDTVNLYRIFITKNLNSHWFAYFVLVTSLHETIATFMPIIIIELTADKIEASKKLIADKLLTCQNLRERQTLSDLLYYMESRPLQFTLWRVLPMNYSLVVGFISLCVNYVINVIDWILDNLIDRMRTRRSVIRKLKELGLIFRAPTKRSNREVREKIPKEFSEEEDSMLRELWEAYGETSDPMGAIISRMPRKRQKSSFVDRLLELGFIADRRECRKKMSKAAKSGDGPLAPDSSSNESDHDSSGSDRASPIRMKPAKKTTHTQRNKTRKPVELSVGETARLLIQAVDNGYTEALRWLAENLEEVALDQEAEGFDPTADGTPLVPLSEPCTLAMEDDTFKKVLRGVGIVPPGDEQETYWRIPSNLHFETIRKRREIIIKAVNKELIIDTIPQEENVNNIQENDSKPNESSDDDNDLFDNLRKLREENTEIITKKSVRGEKPKINQKHKGIDSEKINNRGSKFNGRADSDNSSYRDKMRKIDEADESNSEDESDTNEKRIRNDFKQNNFGKRKGIKHLDSERETNQINSDNDVVIPDARRKRSKRLDSEESDHIESKGKENKDSEHESDVINSESNFVKADTKRKSRTRHRNRFDSSDSEESIKSVRKRNRSKGSDKSNGREKLQKIKEVDEIIQTDDDDILSFAKKTLEHDVLPDTEDILNNIPRVMNDDTDDDEEPVLQAKPNKKKPRIIIEDDSD